jgi:hypothetical protein
MTLRNMTALLAVILGCEGAHSPPADAGLGGSSPVEPREPILPECARAPCTDTTNPFAECCPGTFCAEVPIPFAGTGGTTNEGGPTTEKLCLTSAGNRCTATDQCNPHGQYAMCAGNRICCITDQGGESCRVGLGYACSSDDGCSTSYCEDGVCSVRP